MITAAEARKLSEESDILFNEALDRVSRKIDEVARKGRFEVNLTKTFQEKRFNVEPHISRKYILNDFQHRLKGELVSRGFGFRVEIIHYIEGGGLGLQCFEDGDTPPEQKVRYEIIVGWWENR